ncbi:MAG: histone deacetylase [Spirochaetales bacterium]|nr:histone deacetylase [Leptospiraceae bacterium]MCP5483828.1 histone deacetylase [Spirochaetales bacterium]
MSEALPVFVFSERYNLDLGAHVFPAIKFGHVYRRLRADSRFRGHRFEEPVAVTREEALLAHSRAYVRDLIDLNLSKRTHRSELPLVREIVDAFFLASGGTLEAARFAIAHGRGMNLSGGFHHAFRDHAEGFCYLNDVGIAVRVLLKEGRIKNALVIDLDVHQGNGTARMFRFDRRVFTFSMHEQNNYPIKEKSSLDVGLRTSCSDDEYNETLQKSLDRILDSFSPDIVFYLAGVDVFERDRLGGLSLTKKGVMQRDAIVRDRFADIPLVTVLAGGYAAEDDDTIALHFQTCEVLAGFQ